MASGTNFGRADRRSCPLRFAGPRPRPTLSVRCGVVRCSGQSPGRFAVFCASHSPTHCPLCALRPEADRQSYAVLILQPQGPDTSIRGRGHAVAHTITFAMYALLCCLTQPRGRVRPLYINNPVLLPEQASASAPQKAAARHATVYKKKVTS
jgi:hypothetical protein